MGEARCRRARCRRQAMGPPQPRITRWFTVQFDGCLLTPGIWLAEPRLKTQRRGGSRDRRGDAILCAPPHTTAAQALPIVSQQYVSACSWIGWLVVGRGAQPLCDAKRERGDFHRLVMLSGCRSTIDQSRCPLMGGASAYGQRKFPPSSSACLGLQVDRDGGSCATCCRRLGGGASISPPRPKPAGGHVSKSGDAWSCGMHAEVVRGVVRGQQVEATPRFSCGPMTTSGGVLKAAPTLAATAAAMHARPKHPAHASPLEGQQGATS